MNTTNKHNFMQKLLFRELYGEVRKCRVRPRERFFNQLPHRLAFSLSQIAPASALAAGHIFLGFTKCGQFLLSYTRTCDSDDNTIQVVYKYRLHWWLFVPYAQLRKVAEVMLFGDQDLHEGIYDNMQICICQWPNELTKLLVYGCSIGGDDDTQTRRVYLTITAVPSLSNCNACYKVATSYEEEDLVEFWNSSVGFSCLRHGFTVHSNFELAQPFPPFMPTIQMRKAGLVVLNAGNFLHVLSVNLENIDRKIKDPPPLIAVVCREPPNSADDDSDDERPISSNAIAAPPPREIGNKSTGATTDLGPTVTAAVASKDEASEINRASADRDREWEIFVASVPAGSRREHREPRQSEATKKCKTDAAVDRIHQADAAGDWGLDSDCSSCCRFSPFRSVAEESAAQDSDTTVWSHTTEDDDRSADAAATPKRQKLRHTFKSPEALQHTGGGSGIRAFSRGTRGLGVSGRKPKQARNEYDFIDEISDGGHEKLSTFRRRRLAEKQYEFSDENCENSPQNYRSFRNRLIPDSSSSSNPFHVPFAQLTVELGESSGLIRTMYEKLLSPSSSPNGVLRPINQNISSPVLSPRDGWKDNCDKLDKYELHHWSSRESLNVYSPMSLSQRNAEQASQIESSAENALVKTFKCIVDIERRYLETEDELVSIITDVEDDELSSSTGYHNALPLEVHGSGYAQMSMISRAKAEKLMAPGVRVKQVSLDMEQFCHETAQKLCLESGKKYYFCNDYNIEIIDVCATTGNVVAIASVLLQAGSLSSTKTPKQKLSALGQNPRKLFKVTVTFLFDVTDKTYSIIDHDQLTEQDPYSLSHDEFEYSGECNNGQWWQSAAFKAKQLRLQYSLPTSYYSCVKVMTNQPLLTGKSLTHIMEGHHLVALVL